MAENNNGRRFNKTDEDIRNEGIVLIKNALKARRMSEPLLDSYFCNTSDRSDINWACYLTQQAFELSLKGLIKYYGEDFREGHFIRYNAQFITDSLMSKFTELKEISEVLTKLQGKYSVILYKWESISRYKNLYVTHADIVELNDLLNDLILFIHRHNYL